MDYLLQLFRGLIDNPGQAEIAFAVAVGATIGLLILAIELMGAAVIDPLNRRLRTMQGRGAPAGEPGLIDPDTRRPGRLAQALEHVGGYFLPRKKSQRSQIEARLVHAGYDSETAVSTFHAFKILCAVALPTGVFVAAGYFPTLSVFQVGYAALVAGFIGLVTPNMVLRLKEERRKRILMNGFPDALDLMVACTEAGMGLSAAIQRTADQLSYSHPELAQELSQVIAEMRGGIDQATAFRNLWERTGLEGIRGLVSTLSQSLRFGTSVAETLRVYSEDFRDRRLQAAEEQAAKIGIKLIFPLTFCLFPAFFLVAIGPAILGALRALGQQ